MSACMTGRRRQAHEGQQRHGIRQPLREARARARVREGNDGHQGKGDQGLQLHSAGVGGGEAARVVLELRQLTKSTSLTAREK